AMTAPFVIASGANDHPLSDELPWSVAISAKKGSFPVGPLMAGIASSACGGFAMTFFFYILM
ncbi:hypothetical protein JXO59_04915, partial [candidate division KSB1 bacterium]|nr:hypothetical protein [candidate division KSB1 bacterium]